MIKVHKDIEQGSEEWYAIRLGKVTGSRFNEAVSKGRNGGKSSGRENYMYQLAFERLNKKPCPKKFKGTTSMDWGTETEDEARDAFVTNTGLVVDQVGFIQYNDDIGFSPDGLIGDDGVLEIKCPETITHMKYCGGASLPKKYRDQMQGGMMVTGRKYCWFVSYDPRHLIEPLHKRLIRRDDKYIAELRLGLTMFVTELKTLTEKLKPKPLF